jgi:hypothetical protein
MAVVTLLNLEETNATFDFEHAMAHRNYFGAMYPLPRFSVLPYLIDPTQNGELPASKWHLNHQQAHNDVLPVIPSRYNYFAPTDEVGLFIGSNLIDTDLADEGQRKWWTFANHMEHYIANNALLPFPAEFEVRFPFW